MPLVSDRLILFEKKFGVPAFVPGLRKTVEGATIAALNVEHLESLPDRKKSITAVGQRSIIIPAKREK